MRDLGDPGRPVTSVLETSILFESLPGRGQTASPSFAQGAGTNLHPRGPGRWLELGQQLSEVPLLSTQEIRMLKKVVSVHPVSPRSGLGTAPQRAESESDGGGDGQGPCKGLVQPCPCRARAGLSHGETQQHFTDRPQRGWDQTAFRVTCIGVSARLVS